MISTNLLAQETPQDTTGTGYALGEIVLPDARSISSSYEYDPVLDRYIYRERLGDLDLNIPLILTPQQYEELVIQEGMRDYFKQKIDALSGRKQGADELQRDLLPGYYVESDFFQSIFGGTEINIVPQGTVEMDLGLLYTRNDNPAFSPRNRRNLTFDFDQRISLSLVGQIGERLQINANYDTESTFDFQNQLRLEYTPNEDDIIQKIEVGNVNMPMNNALMQGAQSLFGFKTELQFGKTRVTGVFSEQKSERRTVNVEGGATIEEFERFALDYDQDRHFFLAHYFRDQYDDALKDYPFINSNIQIQRVQIWVTNRTNNIQNLTDTRNIVAIQDLGETNFPENIGLDNPPAGFINQPPGSFPDNANNDFNPLGIRGPAESVLTQAIRDIATADNGFSGLPVSEGIDYVKLENARQLQPNEYTLNTQLGYISLNQRLSNDEVLGVAFQYTVNGQVFQVGEFANDGVNATGDGSQQTGENGNVRANQSLVVKMLKSTVVNVNEPVWDLMMKNIYSLGAYQLEREDFRMNILYTDPQPLNYIKPAGDGEEPLPEDVQETPLLRVLNLDRLNNNNDPINEGDGFFDYVPGITIDPQNGNIIFTTVEPFGSHLFKKLDNTPNNGGEDYDDRSTWNANQRKYVFKALYETTKIQAEQEEADKNKFQLRGRYKSAEVEGIPIGFNLPQGSVTVTAGGRVLQEGVDYVVNYELGRVQILDEALLASNTPIQVNTENNALFGQQTKRFTGLHVEHQFNENFLVGATFLNLKERPLTQKANYGYEPINNSITGFNLNYSTQVPFFTRLINKLPNIDTDVESNLSVRGEFAYLIPGAPNINDFEGKTTTYVDDFEAAQTSLDINNALAWELSSVPLDFGGELPNGDIRSGYKRAKMAWYTIDPIFYSNSRPEGITDNDISNYATRRVSMSEIFPNTDVVVGQPQVVYTMDVAYFPEERGPYNFNPAASGGNELPNPEENFGGMMRGINTTNFEQSNVEFIQFWVMDPYIYPENQNGNRGGKITFNLGNISEDVLKDGRKQFENGLPRDGGNQNTVETAFGKVPADQSLVYAFDSEGEARLNQDVGYDGLSDDEEALKFPGFSNLDDPAADNYEYFLNRDGGIINRYRNYNGIDGNSPSEVSNTNRGNTTLPTAEDVNRDNTMNTIDSYFEYEVPFFPGMSTENNRFITDVKEVNTTMRNGQELPVRWVQFKVPIYEPTGSKGGIADFRSIRFMRMFLSEFRNPTLLRFGTMEMVRGDYRRYNQSLRDQNAAPPPNSNTLFEVAAVNIEENENRQPIPYVLPPGVIREELFENNTNIRQNEQSLSLRVCDLQPQDARAVYKNFQIDMRQYKNLEMFLHAESFQNQTPLKDGQLVAFIRMGQDFSENFYQIEVPLQVTQFGAQSPDDIWPALNRLNLPLELLQRLKTSVLGDPTLNTTQLNFFTEELMPADPEDLYEPGRLRLGIKGNPSFGNIRVLMLGLKNGTPTNGVADLCGEVWFNELRLTELNNEGGYASILSMDTNFADFATISATGRQSTVGFGNLDQGPNLRSQEDLQQYDVVTNLNMGQLLPSKWGLRIPVNYSRGEELITPKYDQEFLDLELETRLRDIQDASERERVKKQSQSYTKRQNISVIGLRKDRVAETERDPRFYDVENITLSGSYNQVDHRDFEVEEALDQNVRVGATYEFNFQPKTIEPFKNIAVLDSSDYFTPIKDLNFNLLPSNINASSSIFRQYNEQKFRSLELRDDDIGIPTLYQRNYMFDWQYGFNYNLTRSLNFSFNASNNRIIRNYIDEEGFADNSVGLWDDFFEIGRPNLHYQSLQLNYELPLNKLPVFSFINATYSYNGDFQWQRGSQVFSQLEGIPDIGNTVQNSNTHQLNANLDMQKLYNYVGLVKRDNRSNQTIKERSAGVPTLEASGNAPREEQERQQATSPGFNTLVSIATMIKRIQVNYRDSRGTFLPGYTASVGFMGTFRPTTAFTFGLQDDVRHQAARRGWLTLFQNFNQQYSTVANKQLNIQSSLDVIPDLTIDLSATRSYAETFNENYRVDPVSLEYISLTPYTYGNFNISTILIKTAFNQTNITSSETFETFRQNRLEVARRVAAERGLDPNNTAEDGYPVGIGKTNQAVLLPAFIAAYSGTDPGNVKLGAFRDTPLPNWNVKYTGFMKMEFFKRNFRRFSLNHGYQSNYTLNQFQTNLDYDPEAPFEVNQAGDFKNPLLYSNIVLTEMFSPLVRIDMETTNAIQVLAELRKDRALALSFDNNLLTETSGNEYILGLGYRIKELKISTKIAGRNRMLSSDLNFKADVSFRRNNTIIRYLDLESSQVIAGQDIWGINFTADYALSRNLTALIYYDHTFSEYAVSTAFPQTTIRSGITLRYNFGN